jgi:hypothetical protein
VGKVKPAAKEITEARAGARRHHRTAGEALAVAPRLTTPTKRRPSGETSITRNAALERPAVRPPHRPSVRPAEDLRVGTRKPKRAKKVERARSAKKH